MMEQTQPFEYDMSHGVIQRRIAKDNSAYSAEPSSISAAPRNEATTDQYQSVSGEHFINSQIKKLRTELTVLISIPFFVLLLFGGNAALLVLTFGSIACYIMDLLEAVEVHCSLLFSSLSSFFHFSRRGQ
jgi:hypothetical protein